ncbi:MAG TPA: GNAT family protein [Bacillota bacterium]|nr:GNAT family protein [Bacillota bacterium]
MHFQSDRLYFREFRENDFPLFYSIFSDEQVMRYAWIDRYEREEDAWPYFWKILRNNTAGEKREAAEFAVFLAENEEFIGFADIEIHQKNETGGCGEIGYFLLPPHWGRGYAAETARTIIKAGFESLNLHRITARCNANNRRSERIMQKVGMIKEGEFRKARFKDGRWDNELHYSILVEEWKKQITVD